MKYVLILLVALAGCGGQAFSFDPGPASDAGGTLGDHPPASSSDAEADAPMTDAGGALEATADGSPAASAPDARSSSDAGATPDVVGHDVAVAAPDAGTTVPEASAPTFDAAPPPPMVTCVFVNRFQATPGDPNDLSDPVYGCVGLPPFYGWPCNADPSNPAPQYCFAFPDECRLDAYGKSTCTMSETSTMAPVGTAGALVPVCCMTSIVVRGA